MAKQIFVTGHKSPDTDSICSSIAYAKLKQLQGIDATPIRAGEPNKETAFALNYFHVAPQPLVKDFYVKVSEAVHTEVEALPVSASLKDAAKWFASHESDVAPVADNGQFVGVIEKGQLADEFVKTVMGEELSTVKALAHDPELFFKPTDNGHDIPADGKYAVVENGKYVGMICADCVAAVEKQQVILVDHNERSQAVSGLERAEIMEIIDHHRIGSIETEAPALFRNMPVGCTSTIIYQMYKESGIEIPKNIAGLMLSAIMSDTLAFRSPTCTSMDVNAGEALAKLCGEDIPTYSDAMFEAGADLTGRTAEEVFNSDFKVFSRGHARFGVGQGSYMTKNSRVAAENLVRPFLAEAAKAEELPMIFYMFTDVKSQSTDLMIYGNGAEDVVAQAFDVTPKDGMALLKGVVSRKKQIIPPIMATLQKIDEDD